MGILRKLTQDNFLTISNSSLKSIGKFNPFEVLVIRFSRTGRRNQAAYRIVVAEKTAPVKGKFVEVIGHYNPSEGKKLSFKKDRVEHWIGVGAQPSDSVAMLLRSKGVSLMDPFVKKLLNKPKKKKVEPVKEEAPKKEEVVAAEAPAEETVVAAEEAALAPAEEPTA